MQAILHLGNDIVDLRLPDNLASAADRRYVERVLAPRERDSSSLVVNNNRVFWTYWAAKEAAYKAMIKTEPGLVFAHQRYLVNPDTIDELASAEGNAKGFVLYRERQVPVSWSWNGDWVHCVTGTESDQQVCRIGELKEYKSSAAFEELQRSLRLPDASVVTRLLAQSLLRDWGIDEVQIVRVPVGRRYGPPQIHLRGSLVTDLDISLSHDGRYAATVIRKLL